MILTGRPKIFLQAWTYGLDGKLLKATRITGIQNFNVKVCCEIPKLAITFEFLYNIL